MTFTIRPLADGDLDAVVALALEAWRPIFTALEADLGREVYRLLFPDWREAQARTVETICTAPEHDVWVAVDGERPIGFVATAEIDEDATRAGEILILAVDPDHQGSGVGTALAEHALAQLREAGLPLAVIGTGGDEGHAPARALYERLGFRPYHHVRYYRRL